MTQPLDLNPQDSGTEEAPIVYRARQGQEVRLVEGRVISSWKTVTDAGVLARIDEQARGNVLQADLRAKGSTTSAKCGRVIPGAPPPRGWNCPSRTNR